MSRPIEDFEQQVYQDLFQALVCGNHEKAQSLLKKGVSVRDLDKAFSKLIKESMDWRRVADRFVASLEKSKRLPTEEEKDQLRSIIKKELTSSYYSHEIRWNFLEKALFILDENIETGKLLEKAICKGKKKMIGFVFDHLEKPLSADDYSFRQAFEYALQKRQYNLVYRFLEHDSDFLQNARCSLPYFIKNATNQDIEMMEHFLKLGENINGHSSRYGYTPLIDAIRMGELKVVRFLLEYEDQIDLSVKSHSMDKPDKPYKTAKEWAVGCLESNKSDPIRKEIKDLVIAAEKRQRKRHRKPLIKRLMKPLG